MRWMVIYGYGIPGGALNLSSTKLPRPWLQWESSPSRKNPHGKTGNRTRYLMISSQKLWLLDHEAGHICSNESYLKLSMSVPATKVQSCSWRLHLDSWTTSKFSASIFFRGVFKWRQNDCQKSDRLVNILRGGEGEHEYSASRPDVVPTCPLSCGKQRLDCKNYSLSCIHYAWDGWIHCGHIGHGELSCSTRKWSCKAITPCPGIEAPLSSSLNSPSSVKLCSVQ
jgi:hypothetical protein